jgi:hypothetical protein
LIFLVEALEEAPALADEIEFGQTGFLIERALDEARSHQFRSIGVNLLDPTLFAEANSFVLMRDARSLAR